ncbi:MAG: hypothetical protein R2744_10245 [Bacteroidales bacterium]
MKKLKGLLIIIIALVLVTPAVQSQESSFNPKMVIKTNPLSALGGPFWVTIVPITGEYKILFEIKTLPKQSFTLGASYLGPSLLLNLDEITNEGSEVSGIKTSGFKVQGMYKFFISRNTEAPEGFYVGPHGSYATASLTSKDNTADKIIATKINFDGVIGYQMITDGGFALDLYTGLGFKNRTWKYEGTSSDTFDFGDDKSSPTVAFGFNFGYAF